MHSTAAASLQNDWPLLPFHVHMIALVDRLSTVRRAEGNDVVNPLLVDPSANRHQIRFLASLASLA